MARIKTHPDDKCFVCRATGKKLTLQKFWTTRKQKPIRVDRRVCLDCQQLFTEKISNEF